MFEGAGLGNWDVSKVNDMHWIFHGAAVMNANLATWDVAKVTTMRAAFAKAAMFEGAGLATWDTSAVTDLFDTFYNAGTMNASMVNWDVSKVQNMQSLFSGAVKFEGAGLASWNTSAVTSLRNTFGAGKMNADMASWIVSKVTDMERTFNRATQFEGAGLASWDTSAVTSLHRTFEGARVMNSNLASWIVSKVNDMQSTFHGAANFEGGGLESWNVTAVLDMAGTFNGASSLNSCNKRKIADAWADNTAFTDTMYDTYYFSGVQCGGSGCGLGGGSIVTTEQGCKDAAAGYGKKYHGYAGHTWFAGCIVHNGEGHFVPLKAGHTCDKTEFHQDNSNQGYLCQAALKTSYNEEWAAEPWCIGAALNDTQFKTASWDWVENTISATGKWGAIGGWNVREVKDMSYAFSKDRDETGGSFVSNGNSANIASFIGAGLETWHVAQVTTMDGTFTGAASLAPCNKRKIADAWKSSAAFTATNYDEEWSADTCLPSPSSSPSSSGIITAPCDTAQGPATAGACDSTPACAEPPWGCQAIFPLEFQKNTITGACCPVHCRSRNMTGHLCEPAGALSLAGGDGDTSCDINSMLFQGAGGKFLLQECSRTEGRCHVSCNRQNGFQPFQKTEARPIVDRKNCDLTSRFVGLDCVQGCGALTRDVITSQRQSFGLSDNYGFVEDCPGRTLTVNQSCGIRCDEAKGFMPHPSMLEARVACGSRGWLERTNHKDDSSTSKPVLQCVVGCGDLSGVLPNGVEVDKCESTQAVGVRGTRCTLRCSKR
jgi:hypothetical protein